MIIESNGGKLIPWNEAKQFGRYALNIVCNAVRCKLSKGTLYGTLNNNLFNEFQSYRHDK